MVAVSAQRRGDIILAVYEAVANAVEHAYRTHAAPGTVAVHARSRTSTGMFEVTVTDTGHWTPRTPPPERGRGLALMDALSDSCTVCTGPAGTTVILDWQLVSPAGQTGT